MIINTHDFRQYKSLIRKVYAGLREGEIENDPTLSFIFESETEAWVYFQNDKVLGRVKLEFVMEDPNEDLPENFRLSVKKFLHFVDQVTEITLTDKVFYTPEGEFQLTFRTDVLDYSTYEPNDVVDYTLDMGKVELRNQLLSALGFLTKDPVSPMSVLYFYNDSLAAAFNGSQLYEFPVEPFTDDFALPAELIRIFLALPQQELQLSIGANLEVQGQGFSFSFLTAADTVRPGFDDPDLRKKFEELTDSVTFCPVVLHQALSVIEPFAQDVYEGKLTISVVDKEDVGCTLVIEIHDDNYVKEEVPLIEVSDSSLYDFSFIFSFFDLNQIIKVLGGKDIKLTLFFNNSDPNNPVNFISSEGESHIVSTTISEI